MPLNLEIYDINKKCRLLPYEVDMWEVPNTHSGDYMTSHIFVMEMRHKVTKELRTFQLLNAPPLTERFK